MILPECQPVLRGFEPVLEPLNLGLQIFLPLASRFQFLLDDLSVPGIRVGPFQLLGERCDVAVANTLLEGLGQPAFQHLGEAAQLLLDRFRLLDQDFKDAVFLAVGVDDVVAVELCVRLELAVDAAVALFEAARIPGHVEVEQVPTMSLEVQALAGSAGGDQDTDRLLLRVGREGPLDLLPPGLRRRAVVDGDPLAGPVRRIDGGRELLLEVTLGVVVLGEDEDPVFVPPGRRALGLRRSEGRQVGAQVLSNPAGQLADPGVGNTLAASAISVISSRSCFSRAKECGRAGVVPRVTASIWVSSPAWSSSSESVARSASLSMPPAKRDGIPAWLFGLVCSFPVASNCRCTVRRWTWSVRANASTEDSRRCCSPEISRAALACLRLVSSFRRSSLSSRYWSSRTERRSSGVLAGRPLRSIWRMTRLGNPPATARRSSLSRRTITASRTFLARTGTPRQKRCGSRISSSAEKLFECPLCGVAERNSRCSNRPAKSRMARVIFESIAYFAPLEGAAWWASSRMSRDPARKSPSQSRSVEV